MAGSRSQSIIDSVEKFWKTEMDPLSYDNNIKILTAGVKNMYSIAQCAEDLISENDGTKAYLTYQRLVKVLDFVWKGAQSLQNIVLKSDPSREPPEDLSDTFEVFREVLDTLKCKPPREEKVKDTNKIPNSSAIELLLELFYKTTPEVPENIYEFLLAFEAKFGKNFTETNHCGLPNVVFICFVPGGMITTASAAKWEVSFEEKGKKQYMRYEGGVNSKLRVMHRNRFRLASTETAKEKFAKVKAAYGKWQQGGPTMSRELKDERFKAFKHLRRQGGAFQVLAGAGSILKIYQPCIKCRHLYRFDYIGQKATDNREKDETLWAYGHCAEDLCHNLWANNKASDRKPNTSLC